MKNFIHCHLHTHFSNSILTDSPNSPDDYIKRAKELGMRGLIFTEHGNCISWYKKKKALESAGMKYVHAVEGYVCSHLDQTNSFHILVYAINYDGKNEINRLITKSYLRDGHFYRRPRFTIDELLSCKNIIISTACLAGVLNAKEDKSIANKILEWGDKNEGRLFLEIQPHNHPEQIEYNKKLIDMNEYGVRYRFIATNDVHYTDKEYGSLRKEMQLSKKMNFTDEDSFDLSMKSYNEMLNGFIQQGIDRHIAEVALENTNVLYDMIEVYDMDKSFKFPHIYDNAMQEMVNRCLKEFHNKGFTGKQEYVDRLMDELETFKVMGAESYMLLFSDWAKGCLEMDIQWGFSRGSASGSLVSYLLGITDIDPIMWNTSFSRFMNRHRITLADIDVDISPSQRNQAKKWFYDHPKLNCSEIIAHGTEQEKGSIDAICRAMNISLDDAKKIKSNISDARKSGDWDELFEKVDGLNGCVVSISSHPAGVLVSDLDIESELGLITITDKTAEGGARSVCQLNMKELEELGYVKADALGLANIGVINQTFKYINKERLNPQTCDFNDMNVWNEIRKSPVGIFQFEKESSHKQLCMALDNIQGAELIQVMSLTSGIIRPSGDSIRTDYLTGKKYDNGHPAINNLFKNNSGYCVDEDTRISTSNGYKKIKDINVGDMVNTLDGYRRVNMVFDNGEKECYELITKCGYKLTCTLEHKVMTSSGYKKVKDLDADLDSIVISLNDCTEIQHTSVGYARILGMLCGDGMLTQRRIVKFISNNIKQAQEFKDLVSSEFKDCDVVIREDFYEEKNNLFVCTVVNKVKFSNNIKSMIKELISDGYKSLNGGCGALDKFIPKRIMNSNRNVKLSFISGLLDTDGSITAKGHVRFKTASEKLANDIQDILRSIGYMSNIYKAHEKSYDITVRNGSYLHFELIGLSNKANNIEYKEKNKRGLKIVSNRFINENLPKSYSKEKYPDMKNNTFASLFSSKNQLSLDRISGYSIEKELKSETQYLLNKECCFDRIDSISLIGNKKVYDIEVDDNHSYFANGIVVHNCTYQEDIMLFLKEFCGYSDHEADTVRRGIAKKIGTEHLIDEIERRFISFFSKNYNETEDKCKELIQGFLKIVDNASSYSFSYNHSLPYSMTGYICAYLRYYHPKEYYTAMLNEFNDKPEKMKEIYTHIYQHSNISVEAPVFGRASMDYSYDKFKDVIYEGMAGLKGVSKNIESALNELPNDIDNYLDLLIYIKENKLKANKKDLNTLIKVDFFRCFGSQKYLLGINEVFFEQLKYNPNVKENTKAKKIELIQNAIAELNPHEDFTYAEKMLNELAICGRTSKKMDWLDNDALFVLSLEHPYPSQYVLKGFNMKTGDVEQYKVQRDDMVDGLEKEKVIIINNCVEKEKKQQIDGKWVSGTGIFYKWIKSMSIVEF